MMTFGDAGSSGSIHHFIFHLRCITIVSIALSINTWNCENIPSAVYEWRQVIEEEGQMSCPIFHSKCRKLFVKNIDFKYFANMNHAWPQTCKNRSISQVQMYIISSKLCVLNKHTFSMKVKIVYFIKDGTRRLTPQFSKRD